MFSSIPLSVTHYKFLVSSTFLYDDLQTLLLLYRHHSIVLKGKDHLILVSPCVSIDCGATLCVFVCVRARVCVCVGCNLLN